MAVSHPQRRKRKRNRNSRRYIHRVDESRSLCCARYENCGHASASPAVRRCRATNLLEKKFAARESATEDTCPTKRGVRGGYPNLWIRRRTRYIEQLATGRGCLHLGLRHFLRARGFEQRERERERDNIRTFGAAGSGGGFGLDTR